MKRAYGYKFVCLRVQLVILRKLGVVELVATTVHPRRRHWWWVNVHRRYQIHYRRWSITATHPFINPSAFLLLLTLPARIHTQTNISYKYIQYTYIRIRIHIPTHTSTIKTISLPILCLPYSIYIPFTVPHTSWWRRITLYTRPIRDLHRPHHHVYTWLDAVTHFKETILFEYCFSTKS